MHLPQEGKRFTNVDRQWRKTLDKVQAAPQIITFCDNEELKEQWIKSNAELERVQKNLADYLETKRTAFARFYFLSNDELISILSQTKDPNAVQPHLRKCFEAVHAITMRGVECEMVDMVRHNNSGHNNSSHDRRTSSQGRRARRSPRASARAGKNRSRQR